MVDKVLFGETCNGDASITKLWFHEGESHGSAPELGLCIAPRVVDYKARPPEQVCPFLGYGEASKVTPITVDRIDEGERPVHLIWNRLK
jgi:hypothetical protein